MLDIVIINNYLNIFDLINVSITDNYNNILVKDNFKRLINNYYTKNIEYKDGVKLQKKYSKKNKKCDICGKESENTKVGHIDVFQKKITCFNCKTRLISRTKVYNRYKIYDEDLYRLDFLELDNIYGSGKMILYSEMEVLILFYIKYKILNPDILKKRKKTKGLGTREIRKERLIEICSDFDLLEHIDVILLDDRCKEFIKTGKHGIKKMKILLEMFKTEERNKKSNMMFR